MLSRGCVSRECPKEKMSKPRRAKYPELWALVSDARVARLSAELAATPNAPAKAMADE